MAIRAALLVALVPSAVLFEHAKYEAIEKVQADGLVELRAKVVAKGDGECVTVSGRAYRLQSLRASGGHEAGDRSAWDPSGESRHRPPPSPKTDEQ